MQTKLILPQNIFSKIFLSEIKSSEQYEVEWLASPLISKKLVEDKNSLGLISSLDLLTSKDLFLSSEIGISFNALLSNSYIHFKDGQETLEELFLKGDVSSNEIILSKILFKEFYDINVKPTLVKNIADHQQDNLLIIGDENYEKELFLKGLSFAEEVIELISAPYVNFVFAGSDEKLIKDFTSEHKKDFKIGHSEKYEELLKGFPKSSLDFISVNIQHVVFDFEEQDLEGIKSLLMMPYYHGIIKDIIDLKFV
jgi:hypothetical protein